MLPNILVPLYGGGLPCHTRLTEMELLLHSHTPFQSLPSTRGTCTPFWIAPEGLGYLCWGLVSFTDLVSFYHTQLQLTSLHLMWLHQHVSGLVNPVMRAFYSSTSPTSSLLPILPVSQCLHNFFASYSVKVISFNLNKLFMLEKYKRDLKSELLNTFLN